MDEKEIARINHWLSYSIALQEHINNYVVPQYGDYPNDPYTAVSIEELWGHIVRYTARRNSGMRGKEEALRDMLKIGHLASIILARTNGLEEQRTESES